MGSKDSRPGAFKPTTSLGQGRLGWWKAVDWSLSDKTLARRVRKNITTVWRWRNKLRAMGLAPAAPRRSGHTWEEFLAAGLGRDSDAVVAARLGLTHQAISQARRTHGIRARYANQAGKRRKPGTQVKGARGARSAARAPRRSGH